MAASTSDVGLPVGDGLGQEEFDEDGEDEEGLELDENLAFIEVPGQRRMGATQPHIRKNAFARLRVVKNRNTSQHLWIVFGFIWIVFGSV